ncbi:MAG: Abi family protein [Candidatus Obscuribacterales bacterium]
MNENNWEEEVLATFSNGRMALFYWVANDDKKLALDLYLWDIALASALYGPLQHFEIVFRNTLDQYFRNVVGPEWTKETEWLSHSHFQDFGALHNDLPTLLAKKRTRKDYRDNHNLCEFLDQMKAEDNIVAETNLGIWVKFFAKHYKDFWSKKTPSGVKNLQAAFPHINPSWTENAVQKKVTQLNELRNRIAHHNPIFLRDLEEEYASLIAVIAAVSPATANWVHQTSRFRNVLQAPPEGWKGRGSKAYKVLQEHQ